MHVGSVEAQAFTSLTTNADLPEKVMVAESKAESETIKAQGEKDAQIIRAEAEAKAAEIYAAAYGKDPEFYDFYRAMQSYRQTFLGGEGQSSIIMSPDNEYLRQFRGRR